MTEQVIEGYRLSPQQTHVWLLERDSRVYRVQCAVSITGALDSDRLAAALQKTVRRHEILRTSFLHVPGLDVPLQVVLENHESFVLCEIDLSFLPQQMQESEIVEQLERELDRDFDYEHGVVVHSCLLKLEVDQHVLMLGVSALCADLITLENLLDEIVRAYDESDSGSEASTTIQYADFSQWQYELLESADSSEGLEFWRGLNREERARISLPLEVDVDGGSFDPQSVRTAITSQEWNEVQKLAAIIGVSPAIVLLTCWYVLVWRLTKCEEVVVQTAFDGRKYEDLNGAIGAFVKYLPISVQLSDDLTFDEVLMSVSELVETANEWQEYFSIAHDDLQGKIDQSDQLGFEYAELPRERNVAGLSFDVFRVYSFLDCFKLRLVCLPTTNGLTFELFYDPARYQLESVERLASQFTTLLHNTIQAPSRAISELELLSARELEQLVLEWNETEREYEREACLHELFALQAARTPEAIAVSYEAEQLSYRELNERANQVGHYLQGLGVGPEVLVGLCLERSLELVVGLLGILKAGGAYVPVDPQYPVERQGWMLGDAGVNLVLTQSRLVEQLRAQAVRMVALDGEWEAISKESKENPSSAAVSRNVAYVIYTSGSSGQPKGVLVEHRSVINLWTALERGVYEQAGQVKCVSMNAPLGFDASVKQVVQLLNGRRLCVVPETVRQEPAALLRYVRAQGIEVLDTTPSQLRQLLGEAAAGVGSLPAVVLVGGEAVERELWQQLGEQAGTVYYNLYGPTECTVDASVSLVRPGLPVIGRPLANVRLYLLDERGEPVPVGVRGELYIGGAGVARGYWGRAALTAERFVADRWSGKSGERLYRSGDLGRYLPGGEVEFLGRADGQVKIRGHRVEVGEVEAALREYEGVKDCVVVAGAEASGERRLIAYVIGAGGQAAMARELPEAGLYELPNGLAISQQNKNETEYLYDEIFQKQTYLRHGMKLRRGACVFDVGANIGLFSLFVCGQAPGARVYCFEPIKQIYESLRVNSALYGEQVAVFDYGLSNREREAAFTYYPHYTMMSGLSAYADAAAEVRVIESYLENEARGGSEAAARLWAEREELLAGRFEQRTEHCRLRALSDVMQEQGVGQIDLLKVDVQRAELEVLEGIRGEDWQKIKQVVMEVHDGVGEASEGRVEQIRALLEEQGFVVVSEQDELLVGTDRHNLYGWREAYRRELVDEDSAEESGKEKRLGVSELREYLQQRLPGYMVPTAWVLLNELPLTRHGKVDHRRLPEPGAVAAEQEREVVPAQTPVQELLVGIWQQLLGVARVGVDDNFFELGGHSLLATQLMSRVREVCGMEVGLRRLFEAPTVRGLAECVEQELGAAVGLKGPALERVSRVESLPLSFAQQRLWFLDQLEPGSAFYNSPAAVRLVGQLDVAALELTLSEIVRRHEVLRTSFANVGGEPRQVVAAAERLELPVVDLRGCGTVAEREALAASLMQEEAQRPFDLSVGPLLRVKLLQLGETEQVVLLTMHHIVSDGWSMGVLIGEVAALYEAYREGRESPLPELAIQYGDFAVWQREWLQGEVLEQQLSYWRQQLAALPVLELPTDRARPAVQSYRGAHHSFRLAPELAAGLKELSQQEGVTLYMTLLAAFQVLLSRYSGQQDVVVGTPIAGRNRAETESLIGCFINSLVMRADLSGNPTSIELLNQVREVCLGAYAHQDVPFAKLVEELQPERDLSRAPLFQVMFALQNSPRQSLEMSGLRLSRSETETHTARLDLLLSMVEGGDRLGGLIEYNTDLFDADTIRRMLSHYEMLLKEMVADPLRPVTSLPLMNTLERERILVEWNATEREYEREACLHELFATQAAQTPAAIAVSYEDEQLSYQELNERANQVGHYLQRLGVGPESLVAICMEGSLDMIVGLLGILKAGGAYVPVDPQCPVERQAWMLEDAGVDLVLTQSQLQAQLPAHGIQTVALDSEREAIGQESKADPSSWTVGQDPAYVIYTSGSSGQPKGVMVCHRNLVNTITGSIGSFDIRSTDVMPVIASFSFDISLFELLTPLLAGATAIVFDKSDILNLPLLATKLEQVTLLHMVPSLMRQLIQTVFEQGDQPNRYDRLRKIFVGGDVVGTDLLADMQKAFVSSEIRVLYGPTEAAIICTSYLVDPDHLSERRLIGTPLSNVRLRLYDRRRNLVPIGVAGEIFIGGDSVSLRYLNRDALTAEKFVTIEEERFYRSGDLGRYLPDGNLEFLGRIDEQVKVRGYRIELGEIEFVISQHQGVREAVVALRDDGERDKQLVAYIVPANVESAPKIGELRIHAQQKLPEYMVPARWMIVEALPLTQHGKVDRRLLPAPETTTSESTYAGPRTPVEELLVGVWQEVLRLKEIGIHDNFFELGGHSLLATRVSSKLRQRLGMELPVRILFERPTISAIAEWLEESERRAAGVGSPEIKRRESDQELPLSFAQQRLWFLDQLEPGTSFYSIPAAVQMSGRLDHEALKRALNEIVRRHEVLRTRFTTEGGVAQQIVAAEMELELEIIDLQEFGAEEREALAASLMQEEAQRPFDLSVGPLLRVKLLQLGETEQVVLLTMHHIVSDGWSMGVLIGEVAALYEAYREGRESPLPELAIQYGDFAVWQREWLQGEVLEQQLSYWRQQLAALPVLELPTDGARPAVQSYRGAHHSFRLAPELAAGLKELSQQEGVTLYMTLLAAFQVLLSRYSGQQDVVVGTDIANRNRAEIEPLIGFFINQLVLRTDLSGAPSFAELLGRVREVCLGAYAHQDVPFEKLVEELQPERDLSRGPLFQVKLILQNAPSGELRLEGLQLSRVRGRSETAKFDLTVALTEAGGVLSGTVEYNTDLFGEPTMARLVGHYEQLLESIVKDRQVAVSELRMLSERELEQLVVEWNETGREYKVEACLHELFAAQAARTPEAIAVSYEAEQLSYRELNERANQVGHYLQGLGVGPEVLVGLCLERSLEMVVGLLGILKAGGAYVPVDPQYPVERQGWMLGDAGVNLVLTQSQLVEQLPAQSIQTVTLDGEWEAMARESKENPSSGAVGRNLAYVIYTSGSSGQPKGVAIEHQGVCNLVAAQREGFAVGSGSRVLQFASLSFDAAVSEIFVTLGSGGTLCVAPAGELLVGEVLQRVLSEQQISAVTLPPTVLRGLEGAEELERLQTVVVAGEQSESETLQRWLSGGRRVLNAYGPTESSVCATMWTARAAELESGKPRLGRALSNVQVYVLDRELRVVPVGVRGEIYIGGAGVGRGYLQRAEMTAGVFVPDPFSGDGGGRLYRSGDLGRYLESGELEYLGRADQQVKVRGYRIELEEIEARLKQHEAVADCAVVSESDGSGEQRLVCYVVSSEVEKNGVGSLSAGELRGWLQERLPSYMIPGEYRWVRELALTRNGKVDREQLRELQGERVRVESKHAGPRTPVEELLVGVWQEVLRLKEIGIHDNFFELGGDSILSIQIIARASQVGLKLNTKQMFQYQTIAELATVAITESITVAEQTLVTGDVPLTPIQHWFFAQPLHRRHQYNQSLLFEMRERPDLKVLTTIVGHLERQHDALRLRFTNDDYGWRQFHAPAQDENSSLLWVIDLSELDPAIQSLTLEAAAAEIQQSFNLSEGPLWRVVLFDLGIEHRPRLMFVIHHLLTDGVSWRILLEDLQNTYSEAQLGISPPTLRAKTSSYRQWAIALEEAAQSPELLISKVAYWLDANWKNAGRLPVASASAERGLVSEARSTRVALTSEETRALLQEVPRAYNTQINDVLLTAVSEALCRWCQSPAIVIDLEGHGREQINESLDVTRTVGWFTAQYPVLLELDSTSDGAALKHIKEQLQTVPDHGIWYGVGCLSDNGIGGALRTLPEAEISFNYLGQLDQVLNEQGLLVPARESAGATQGPQEQRPHLLEITGAIHSGCLQMAWTYNPKMHERAEIEQVASDFLRSLQRLIEHCRNVQARGYVPSDFPLVKLNQTKLDEIIDAEPDLEDLCNLSPMQEGMFFHTLYEAGQGHYVNHLSWCVEGDFDIEAFARAWQQIIHRHSILRTGFYWEGIDRPIQIGRKRVPFDVQREDWQEYNEEERQALLEEYWDADRKRGFDLRQAPFMRVAAIKMAANEHQVVWTHHHLLLDGWSLSLLIKELFVLYEAERRGERVDLPAVRPYREYIAWLEKQDLKAAEEYWRQQLAGFSAATELVAHIGRAEQKRGERRYQELRRQLSEEASEQLRSFARQQQLTINTVVQGAWALILSRYSGSGDVVFGATVAGRPGELKQVEEMVGLFINTLAVRVRIVEQTGVGAWLRQLQAEQLEMRQYEYSPLVQVQGWSEIERGTPMFETLMVFENYPVDGSVKQQSTDNSDLKVGRVQALAQNHYPLTLNVSNVGGQLGFRFGYDSSIFDAMTVERIGRQLETIIAGLVTDSEQRVFDVPAISKSELKQLVTEWNDTEQEYEREACLHELFAAQAARTPAAIAVSYEAEQLSYQELNERANQVGHYLQGLGVGPEVLVGLCLERSLEMVVGILGILKAGGAYVPVDPQYPVERQAWMLEDAGVNLVLTQSRLVEQLPAQAVRMVALDGEWEAIAPESKENPSSAAVGRNLAYVIYTSGSSGRPKGVMVHHSGLVNYLTWASETYSLNEGHSAPLHSSVCFDLTVTSIFGPLLSGGCVDVFSEGNDVDALGEALKKHPEYGMVKLTPAHLQLLNHQLLPEQIAGCTRVMILGGENLPSATIRSWREHASETRIYNEYGPTETVVGCCIYEIGDSGLGSGYESIGKPIANTKLYILDKGLKPQPVGVAGDIYVGGAGVSRGYVNQPGLTAEKFIPDLYGGEAGARLYRTGDVGRHSGDGNVEFLGRADQQVKLRGYRIELGEIEAALQSHAAVRESVVVAREESNGERRLVGYVVLGREASGVTISELRAFLQAKLPDYMVPSALVVLEELPLTRNGKVDRRSLPAPEQQRVEMGVSYVAPRTPAEELMAGIWQEVLNLKQVGVNDNFFELGGHSLLATQVFSRTREVFQLDLQFRLIFESPTLAEFTAAVEEARKDQSELKTSPIVPVSRDSYRMQLSAEHFS